MNMTEIRKLDAAGVERKLADLRSALQSARFSVSQRQLKNVRSIRDMRKDIARLETVMKQRQS
jgi:large subunit ribosomal protein L29